MKLINDIINELMDTNNAITSALLKTKVLASRLDNTLLQAWVNGELNGYVENSELPSYRESSGILEGSFLNGLAKGSNMAFPVAQIPKRELDEITSIEVRDSITSIELMINKKGLKISVNSNRRLYLQNSIRNMGNPQFQIISVYLEIPAFLFTNILSSVRSKLLDFMLELEKKFGYEAEIDELKAKKDMVTQIFHTAISTNGNGNIITSGNHNDNDVYTEIDKA